jgi:predicted Rossmann-fold nucleotide-binding protein
VIDRQIFVAGTWRPDRAAPYATAAALVGQRIAEAGYDLACGPGTGISEHAIRGFRTVADRTGEIRFYLPRAELMAAVGEEVGFGADQIIETPYDYPMRNVHQVAQSCALIAITGGDGTLEEILPALIDYGLPVAVLAGSGPAVDALEALLPIFPDWRASVLVDEDPEMLVKFVLERLNRAGRADGA